jgi:hypothetical protein
VSPVKQERAEQEAINYLHNLTDDRYFVLSSVSHTAGGDADGAWIVTCYSPGGQSVDHWAVVEVAWYNAGVEKEDDKNIYIPLRAVASRVARNVQGGKRVYEEVKNPW